MPALPPDTVMWPTTREELKVLQNELGAMRPEMWDQEEPPGLIGGCFLCYPKGHEGKGVAGDHYWAAAVRLLDNQLVDLKVASGLTTAPYEPGFLALREGPLLESVVMLLPQKPELLLVNATGRDHPRRAGLALHLGWSLSLPTIGVTRNPLIAAGDLPDSLPGAKSPLMIGDEIVGYLLRMNAGSPPVAVHAGWRTTPETAVRMIEGMRKRWRTPEPLRLARRAAREARAGKLYKP